MRQKFEKSEQPAVVRYEVHAGLLARAANTLLLSYKQWKTACTVQLVLDATVAQLAATNMCHCFMGSLKNLLHAETFAEWFVLF